MANQTVYPYGTGGSLPSSIGLINDLTTGGVDKALTAQQGVVIGDYLFDKWSSVDLTNVTVSNLYLSSGTKWGSNGKHMVVPVTPGTTVKVGVTASVASGGWWAFLASYTVPTTSTTIDYAPNCGREWLDKDIFIEEVVPEGAAYICMCPRDWDGNTSTWTLEVFHSAEMKDDYMSPDSPLMNVTVYDSFDISQLEVHDCYTGPTKWNWTQTYQAKHIVVPVSGGQKVRFRCIQSTAGGNWYAFLTSSYVAPSDGDTIPYAKNSTRTWLNDSTGEIELTAPSNAAYLCLTLRNGTGTGNTSNWLVSLSRSITLKEAIDDYALKSSDVVNNTVDGGVAVPLSAEMGKLIASKISDGIPDGYTKHEYIGETVKVGRTHYVATNIVSTIGNQMYQGGACYGDYLFMFTSGSTTCWIYNLATKSLVSQISIPDGEIGFVSNVHRNTVNFGSEFYDTGDPFPLLYISTGYSDGTNTGALVYRVVVTTANDTTTYALTLVQTLKMPGTGWTEFVTGDEGDCYLCYTSDRVIYRMRMPTLSQGDITFDLSQAIDVYKFTAQPAWYNGSSGQGRVYYDGRIYFVAGEPSKSQTLLFVGLDLATRRRVVEIDLQATFGISNEPEAVFIWNGHFCIVFRSNTGVYALYFD